MEQQKIEEMQKQLKLYYPSLNCDYPSLNCGGCWLFAYAFVSRVWWVWLRCGSNGGSYEDNEWWNIAKNISSNHYVVEYNWMYLDWHKMLIKKDDKVVSETWPYHVWDTLWKKELAIAILEWAWNNKFYREQIGNNRWDVMWSFLHDFESILDKLWVKYSSWL